MSVDSFYQDGMRGDISIEPAPVPTVEITALVAELDEALAALYPPEQRHGLNLAAIFQPHVRFFIVRIGGAAAGCGGVALFEDFAEVKRMYIRPRFRGQGGADSLLVRIEAETVMAGLNLLRLETGRAQPAAVRVYERCGFRRCGAFGAYQAMAPRLVAHSLFYEKRLGVEAV